MYNKKGWVILYQNFFYIIINILHDHFLIQGNKGNVH